MELVEPIADMLDNRRTDLFVKDHVGRTRVDGLLAVNARDVAAVHLEPLPLNGRDLARQAEGGGERTVISAVNDGSQLARCSSRNILLGISTAPPLLRVPRSMCSARTDRQLGESLHGEHAVRLSALATAAVDDGVRRADAVDEHPHDGLMHLLEREGERRVKHSKQVVFRDGQRGQSCS